MHSFCFLRHDFVDGFGEKSWRLLEDSEGSRILTLCHQRNLGLYVIGYVGRSFARPVDTQSLRRCRRTCSKPTLAHDMRSD